MRMACVFTFVFIGLSVCAAQEKTVTLDDDFFQSAEQWAKENLDESALAVLQNADQQKIKQLFSDIRKQFQGQYVLDLAALKDTARAVMPLLESYEETYPYALWLKSRLDYFDMAEQFRLLVPLTERPGAAPKPPANPAPQKERELWITKLSTRPWPENAKPYVNRLKPVFASQGVPAELVWLAEVESSFDPRARSPEGAAGLFQLMPATANRFGLRTTWPWDQRLKPEPSAQAAAQYLRYLHGRFKDWRLALAGYNAGEGTVRDLLKKHKARTFDEIAKYLPAETQMYVPKVEATLLSREGLQLSQLAVPSK